MPDDAERTRDEERRLRALRDHAILDTLPEMQFDGIAALAASFCSAPIALVSLVDEHRQWFKARIGIALGQTPVGQSVCALAIRGRAPFVIPDLAADPRTAGNPLVTGPPGIRFYAGIPLVTPDDQALGTVSVMDTVPRPGGLSETEMAALQQLARQAMALLTMRRLLIERGDRLAVAWRDGAASEARVQTSEAAQAALRDSGNRSRLAQEAGRIGTFELDVASGTMMVSAEFCRIFGLPPAATWHTSAIEALVLPEDRAIRSNRESRIAGSAPPDAEYRIHRANDGRLRWISRRSEFQLGPDGRAKAMIGTVHDVTDRRLATLRLEALLGFGDEIREAQDRGAVAAAAARRLGETLGAAQAGYLDIDEGRGSIAVAAQWAAPGLPALAGPIPVEAFALTLARLRSGQPLALRDVAAEPGVAADAGFAALAVKAAILVPLLRAGRLLGALFVHAMEPRPWSADEITFARGLADRMQAALVQIDAVATRSILNHELSHRLKNSLAMVQAIALQTLQHVEPQEAVDAFADRIVALSSAHQALVDGNWTSADIRTVATQVLGGISMAERVTLVGPDIRIGSPCALSMSLIIHELATNAVKYGALSNDAGTVALSWTVTGTLPDAVFRMRWRETGGPPVTPPDKVSFGTTLIGVGLLGTGGASLRYPPSGVEADFEAPLARIQEP